MGQQQLLLIILGVIIVGIAVVVGLNVFQANSVQANRDAVIADLNTLGSMAQQYYKKPAELGGGGNAFTNWKIPANLASTGNGTYAATVTAATVTIVGTGTELGEDGKNKVKVTMVVDPSKAKPFAVTINN